MNEEGVMVRTKGNESGLSHNASALHPAPHPPPEPKS